MQNAITWGLYPWFDEHGERYIFSADLEKWKKLFPNGKVFKCICEDNGFLVLQYGEETYRVRPNLFQPVERPKFWINDLVKLIKQPEIKYSVVDVNWHYKDNVPIYYVSINGKRKSTRYFTQDLAVL